MRPIGFTETSVSINRRWVTFKQKDDSFPPLQKNEVSRCSDRLLQSAGLCFSELQRSTDFWTLHACGSQLGAFFFKLMNQQFLFKISEHL